MNAVVKHGREILQKYGLVQAFQTSTEPIEVPESAPPPLPAPQPLQSPSSTGVQRVTRSVKLGADPMRSNVRVKTTIADIFAGSGRFDPIDVDDDDDDDVHEVSRPTQNKQSIFDVTYQPRAEQTIPNTKYRGGLTRGKRSPLSNEEKRLFGYREPTPEDALLILPPSRASNMAYVSKSEQFSPQPSKKKAKLSPGLRPMNTLNGNKPTYSVRTSQNDFYTHKLRPDRSVNRPSVQSTTQKLHPQAHAARVSPSQQSVFDDSPQPHKRQRTDHSISPRPSSPTITTRMSQVQTSTSLESTSLHGITSRDTVPPSRGTNGVKHTPLRGLETQYKPQIATSGGGSRGTSPDDLLDVIAASEQKPESEPGDFMQEARIQRHDRDHETARGMQDDMMAGSSRVSTSSLTIQQQHSKPKQVQVHTPGRSKMDYRLNPSRHPDSPDELSAIACEPNTSPTKICSPISPSEAPRSPGRVFNLETFVASKFMVCQNCVMEINKDLKTFSIEYGNSQLPAGNLVEDISIRKVRAVDIPADEGIDVIVLHLPAGVERLPATACYLEFASRKAQSEACNLLQKIDPSIKLRLKPSKDIRAQITNAYMMTERIQNERNRVMTNNPAYYGTSAGPRAKPAAIVPQHEKRLRRVDALDAPPGKLGQMQSDERYQQDSETNIGTQPSSIRSRTVAETTSEGRQTRSRGVQPKETRPSTVTIEIPADPRRTGVKWERSLVYPQEGPRKETVTWDDLSRLEDGEFLNDSVVSLFLRYLQENVHPDFKNRMHFFSTFFYETLTRPGDTKGSKRQINYRGVAKWTKTVDIFQRDFVIVPVNENLHWYVMIICNLQALEKGNLEAEDDDVMEVSPPVDNPDAIIENGPKDIICSDLPADVAESSDINESDYQREQKDKKRPTKRKPPHQKYDSRKPVIITLDSLDTGRSGTAGIIKDYLVQEAQARKNKELDKQGIKGMTAKSIPLQTNFYDCGMYVCLYLEQFMRDPQNFVRSILERDETLFRWPKRIRSAVMRDRLYGLLQALHTAQETKEQPNIAEVGKILVTDEDFRPVRRKPAEMQASMLDRPKILGDLDVTGDDHEIQAQASGGSADRAKLGKAYFGHSEMECEGPHHEDAQVEIRDTMDYYKQAQAPIVIDEESKEQVKEHEHISSPYFESRRVERAGAPPAMITNSPLALARRLQRQRGPERQHVHHVDLLTPEQPREQPKRSDSVSTEFLDGSDSFVVGPETHQNTEESEEEKYTAMTHKRDVEFQGIDNETIDMERGFRDLSAIPDSQPSNNLPMHTGDDEEVMLFN